MAWWCAGVRWRPGGPVLGWCGSDRDSALTYGQELGFVAQGARRCIGVWRGGRRTPCPGGVEVPARGTRAQCAECARIDRSFSVAADTNAGDPRPYRVYLAWFGPGLVKVGITAAERGPARLLEQGAVAFTWLGHGPLMAARRAEELLGAALGVPDRIPYARKRAVRSGLPPWPERVAELADCHARARELTGWPETLARSPLEPVDHGRAFGLDAVRPAAGTVRELVTGGVVTGRLVAAAGPDLHLECAGGRALVLDTRAMSGWRLGPADRGAGGGEGAVTVPVDEAEGGGRPGAVQGGLF